MKKITVGKFGTNSYLLVSKDECIIIDPGYEFASRLDLVGEYKVVGVLLTHCHCDHVDSIGLFNCPIYINEHDFEGLNNQNSLYSLLGDKPSYDFKKLNIITFKDDEELTIGRFQIKTLHTPGHTKGSSCFLYNDELYTGDTLFKESIGRTDFPTGDHKKILNSIKLISKTYDQKTKIHPGHGESTTIKYELQNNLFLKSIK